MLTYKTNVIWIIKINFYEVAPYQTKLIAHLTKQMTPGLLLHNVCWLLSSC